MKRYVSRRKLQTSRGFSHGKFWIPVSRRTTNAIFATPKCDSLSRIFHRLQSMEIWNCIQSELINKNPGMRSQRLNRNDSIKFYETPEIFLAHTWQQNCRAGKCSIIITFVIALREREANMYLNIHVTLNANRWSCLKYFQESRIYIFLNSSLYNSDY